MIVEDDEDFVYLVQKLLKKQKDIEVIIGGKDQKKVLEKVHEEHPDIVLMDLNRACPIWTGFSFPGRSEFRQTQRC